VVIVATCVAIVVALGAVLIAALRAPDHAAIGAQTACPTTRFLNVQPHPKNSAYPAPALSVTCDATSFTIVSNGIPTFEFVQITPNALLAQNYRWTLPLSPTAGVSRSVPLGGASAVAVDGLPIFGPTEAPRDGYRDPYLDQILDTCNGHTAQRGDYHFHARPECLLTLTGSAPGTVLGYGMDGVPILSPFVCVDSACATTRKVTSGWRVVDANVTNAWQKHGYVAGVGDLDVCNGALTSDGTYAYFATDNFPYFMGCYRGTAPADTATFRTRADAPTTTTPPTSTPTAARHRLHLPFTGVAR
jgi:hypothetical protein